MFEFLTSTQHKESSKIKIEKNVSPFLVPMLPKSCKKNKKRNMSLNTNKIAISERGFKHHIY